MQFGWRGNQPRTYGEKLLEALLALSRSASKIYPTFAENAPFGGNVVGLDAAAWRYYGRSADQLSWSESATLAVLPNAPSAIYPGKGHRALQAKRDRLLDRLLKVHAIDSMEWSLAKEEPLPERAQEIPQRAPQLLTTIKAQVGDGKLLRTTVEGALQDRATDAADRYAARLNANEVHNAAAIIVDVPTGEVLAYVGNLGNAGSDHAGSVDIVRARRSTGSVLKPFLYADMLQSGELTPDMMLADVPTRYDGFSPRNYDEHYSGAVPASEALARSLNVPTVRSLRSHGVERTLRMLHGMGLHSIDRSAADYGLSLIVGGAESTLWELAGAYSSMGRVLEHFGRLGMPYRKGDIHPPHVLQRKDDLQEKPTALDGTPVLSASAIHFTLRALREVARPADEQGWSHFTGQKHIAWKTGTSYGHRDAPLNTSRYCIARDRNASGEGRPGLTGTLAAAPLLFDLFSLLPNSPAFAPPYDEMVRTSLCRITGFRAGLDCPQVDTTWVQPEGMRTPTCPYHRRILLDPTGSWRISGGQGISAPWFVLPPAMEHYYAQRNPNYRPLPPWRPGMQSNDQPMEILYPDAAATVLIPVQLDGSRGNMVVEVAHRNPRTTLGRTAPLSAPPRVNIAWRPGGRVIANFDGRLHVLHRTFTIVSGAGMLLPECSVAPVPCYPVGGHPAICTTRLLYIPENGRPSHTPWSERYRVWNAFGTR